MSPVERGYNKMQFYDDAEKRLVKNAPGARTTSVFDFADRLQTSSDATGDTNYTFDASGNQQIVVAPTGSRTTFVWNEVEKRTGTSII